VSKPAGLTESLGDAIADVLDQHQSRLGVDSSLLDQLSDDLMEAVGDVLEHLPAEIDHLILNRLDSLLFNREEAVLATLVAGWRAGAKGDPEAEVVDFAHRDLASIREQLHRPATRGMSHRLSVLDREHDSGADVEGEPDPGFEGSTENT
jgi:hypothetical protein